MAHDVVGRDSSGIRVIDNTMRSIPTGCIALDSEPTAVISTDPSGRTGAPPLFRIAGGAVLSDGSIVVLNAGTQQLLFYSAEGRFLRTVGRRGRGPGEFERPDWLGHGTGDTLFVWDTGLRRITTVRGSGEILSAEPVQGPFPTVRGRFDDGSLLLDPISLLYYAGDGSVDRSAREFRRYDLARDTSNLLVSGRTGETVDGPEGPYELPFGKNDHFGVQGEFLVVGGDAEATLRYYDLTGRLARVVHWPSDPIAVTEADRRRYAEWVADQMPVGAPRPTKFADTRPRFADLEIDRLGLIWVEDYRPPWGTGSSWLVFEADGALRCRVALTTATNAIEIGRDYLLGIRRTETGEPVIERFAIDRAR